MIQLRARGLAGAIIASALAVAVSVVHAKTQPIAPGPTVMSPDEIALAADPARGLEGAAILQHEVLRVDGSNGTEVTFHMRAKILSNEGRDVANVKIDLAEGSMSLRKWWGRVIFPDGRVLELPESALEEQAVVRTDEGELSAMTAALPGVEPGCVIDYGFVIRANSTPGYFRTPLRRDVPVLSLLYRWRPNGFWPAAATLQRVEGLNVTSNWEKHELTVRGRDLPRVTQEPLMPPDSEMRGALVLYYISPGLSFDDYWDKVGDFVDRRITSRAAARSMKKVLAAMGVSSRESSEEVLRGIYDWIARNMTRTDLRSFEDLERGAPEDGEDVDTPAKVIEARAGSGYDLSELYVTVARALGAQAHLVLVADRTENFVDPALKNVNQFDAVLVALRTAEGADAPWTFLDPGSGLPFGEVPWFNSGVYGLMLANRRSGQETTHLVLLPVTEIANNIGETRGDVGFTEDNGALTAKWIFKGRGQVGLTERRYLRRASPEDRSDRLDTLCGAAHDVDVRSAEAVNLDDVTHDFELHCEAELLDAKLSRDMQRYELDWASAWVRAIPDLPPGPREHAVVFDFPRADTLYLNIAAPAGFAAAEAPAEVRIEHEFGNYALRVSRTDSGYFLERGLGLFPLGVEAERYEEIRAFLEQVRRADETRLAFTRVE